MELTPRKKDKLLIFTAALLAEQRMARGGKLNYPEAVVYLSTGTAPDEVSGARWPAIMPAGAGAQLCVNNCEGDTYELTR